MADNLKFIPNPPKVTTLAGTTWKPRIFFDDNCTPIFLENPHYVNDSKNTEPDKNGRYMYERNTEPQEYMRKCGFISSIMAYDGTLNLSRLWWNFENNTWEPTAKPGTGNRYEVQWTMPDGSPRSNNYCDPVVDKAAWAVCALARTPTKFGASVGGFRPIWTDIEGHQDSYNARWYYQPAPSHAVEIAKMWLEMAKKFRLWPNGVSDAMEFYTYGGHLWPDYEYMNEAEFVEKLKAAKTPEETAAATIDLDAVREFALIEAEHSRYYSGFTQSAYNGDMSFANNGESFYATVDRGDKMIDKYYPHFQHNKFLFVTPTWQIYWPDNLPDPAAAKAASNKPIPLDSWKDQIDYAVTRGWNIFCWLGITWDLPSVKQHLDYLLRFK